MATRPTVKTLSASAPQILNAIRNSATDNYRNAVPVAEANDESIRVIGQVIMAYKPFQNEFLSALVNRIGSVIFSSKSYSNPWNMFKKGMLDYGESIEEIFTNLIDPHAYDPVKAETEVFKREIPDVRAAFHILNYKEMYKATVSRAELAQAFLSADGVTTLVTSIIDRMYASANYDEFLVMKYMIAKYALDGNFYPVTIETVSSTNMKGIVSKIKGMSNSMEFMSPNYNKAGVYTYASKDSQYLIVNSAFDAVMDVEVLAAAFNMDKAEFMGHKVLVDSFANLDNERLAKIFADDPNYTEIQKEQLEALDKIPAILVDRDWFMIYDNLQEFTDIMNPQGLYWNYFLHTWKIVSSSPFKNAAIFVPGTPTVTSVTVSPSEITVNKGGSAQFSATVKTENFASQEVNWSLDHTENSSIDIHGFLTVGENESNPTLTVTATSVLDSQKSNTATVTVQGVD